MAEASAQATKDTLKERSRRFAARWSGTTSEKSEAQTFWNEFFAIFGVDRVQVGSFEQVARRTTTGRHGWVDVLIPGKLGVEHKSAGEDLDKALDQLVDYLPSLKVKQRPRLLVVCDFERFECIDVVADEAFDFKLDELAENLHRFWWLAGYDDPDVTYDNEEDANLAATALLADIHDELIAAGYDPHPLREWLTRILFCLFADDTGVWDPHAFHAYIAARTRDDGSDLGAAIATLFQVLDTEPAKRSRALDEDLTQFTYINGDLFDETLEIPFCTEAVREAVLAACRFDWSVLSPAIFGSMFQNVMTPDERRQLGAHYTTEENILKTIRPLFVDDLEKELAAATSQPKLLAFLDKLATLRFFDPAAGCGNFLVIAYRELRRIEREALRRLREKQQKTGQMSVNVELEIKCDVAQFYAIEIEEFPAKIARTALYLMDHLANRELSREFGQHFVRFPIPASPTIVQGNALRLDWNDVLPAGPDVFVFGNPPFVGRKQRTPDQKSDMEIAWDNQRGHAVLDYVTGWFIKAVRFTKGTSARVAFVATNSVSQGENVSALWPRMYAEGVTIDFAHRTFEWKSEARGRAHVHVVIVGFSHVEVKSKRLFTYATVKSDPVEETVSNISPYLADGPDTVVVKALDPISPDTPPSLYGSTAIDNGHLLVQPEDVADFRSDPIASKYLRPYIGATELIAGTERWVLWLKDAPRVDIRTSALLKARVEACKKFRENSNRAATKRLAATPHLLGEPRPADTRSLVVPCVSSTTRQWVPAAFRDKDTMTRASSWCIPDADLFTFGILSSSMFAAWARGVGGGMKSDLQVSQGTVYNTFPWAKGKIAQRTRVETAAQKVLDARAAHPGATLEDLYDPLAMPSDLVKAHGELDRAVDPLFAGRKRVKGEADRLGILLERYVELTASSRLQVP